MRVNVGVAGVTMGTESYSEDGCGPERLPALGSRTSLMALDLLLRLVPHGEVGFADAAAEARELARRVQTATKDYRAAMETADQTG